MATGSSGLPRTGVEAVVVGINQFLANLGKMNAAAAKTGKGLQSMAGASNKSAPATQTAGKAATVAATLLGALGKTAAVAAGSLGTLVSALGGPVGVVIAIGLAVLGFMTLKKVITGVIDTIKAAASALFNLANAAAPLPGISAAFAMNAAKFGVSLGDMRTAARGAVSDFELMRQANVALAGSGNEVGRVMGQALPELLEISRAAARATGQDAEFLFQSLVSGVKRSSPLLIDNTGLVLRITEANEAYAQSIGKTVEALSAEERQIALLNATLEAGQTLIAGMGDAQQTAAENTATARAQFQNLKDTLGLALQPAFQTVTAAIARFATAIATSVQEGGKLYGIVVTMGAVLSILADMFAAAVDMVLGFGNNFNGTLGDVFNSAADTAFRAGVAIVDFLTQGMLAALDSLIMVINWIANLLTFWFMPQSPPRIAPNIDRWGAETVAQWLHGMTQADFGILRTIQGPLRQILDDISFGDISVALMEALSTGVFSDDLFAQITSSAGELGGEIAQLVRLQLDLAAATEAAARANENFLDAQDEVVSLTEEYNRMLREGATEDELAAQLARINAAEDARGAALAEARDAEDRVDSLQDQAALQELLVAQMIELARLQQQTAAGGGGGGGGGGGAAGGRAGGGGGVALPTMPDLGGIGAGIDPAQFDIAGRMADAIAARKEEILARLEELMQPIEGRLDELKTKFQNVGIAIERAIWPVIPTLEALGLVTVEVGRAAGDTKIKGGGLASTMQTEVTPSTKFLTLAMNTLSDLMSNPFTFALKLVTGLMKLLAVPFRILWGFIKVSFGPAIEILTGLFSPLGIATLAISVLLDALGIDMDELTQNIEGPFSAALSILEGLLDPIAEGFRGIGDAVRDTIGAIADMIEEATGLRLPPAWTPGSPTPAEVGFRGIADAMGDVTTQMNALQLNIPADPSVGAQAQVPGPTAVGGPQITIPVSATISNGMTQAAFEAMIEATVRRSLS